MEEDDDFSCNFVWFSQEGAFPGAKINAPWHEIQECISINDSTHIYFCKEEETERVKQIAIRITQLLQTQPTILSIGFLDCEFEDDGCRAIAAELPNWNSLTTLCMVAKYGNDGVKALCDALENSTIPELFFNAPFSEAGVETILQFMAEGRLKLTKLSISYAKIGRELYQRVFQVLKNDHSLKYFGFPETNGDLQTIPYEWLEDCFAENSTLETLFSSYGVYAPIGWYAVRNRVCNALGANKLLRNSIPRHLEQEKDIHAFVSELMKSSEELRAMKLIVLGNGRIGKTTLLHTMQKILDPNFQAKPEDITSTVGIDCGCFHLAKGHISVWDFAGQLEYTATHAFFLSVEMASIIVCFNLGLSLDDQSQQITYWLDFLNSSLALPTLNNKPNSVPKWNIIIVGLRSDEQMDFSLTQNPNIIKMWQKWWPRLPIAPRIFTVSSLTSVASVETLLTYVEEQCSRIFEFHATQIPTSYQHFIGKLEDFAKDTQLIHWKDFYKKFGPEMNMKGKAFKTMLTYLQSIGRIVWLPNGSIFTDPTTAPKIAAKFISPKEVRLALLKKECESVQILDETEIGCLLDIDTTNNDTLRNELELLVHLRISFKLHTADSDEVLYLFPSLSASAKKFQFSKVASDDKKSIAGVRFTAPKGTMFVQGFICQLLVEIFSTLNIYRADIEMVCENGAIIRCPGLFAGEMIVMTEFSHKTIIVAMNASDTDTQYAVSVFNDLVQKRFSQYTGSKKEVLCAECLTECFRDGTIEVESVGVFQQNWIVCSTNNHSRPSSVGYLQNCENCKAHDRDHHHIFLNYRVKSEGRRSLLSSVERDGGVIEHLFNSLAVQKTRNGLPLFVFWDCKCLNDGQNWEAGFMRGLQQSQVVVLVMSNSATQGIAENAQNYQDNVLIEYESALLLNKLYRVPVFPLFLAEVGTNNLLTPFSFSQQFPDVPHKRNESSQQFIDTLSKNLPPQHTKFLSSIKSTMAEIFMLQGVFMEKRVEDPAAVKDVINRILKVLEKAPVVRTLSSPPDSPLSLSHSSSSPALALPQSPPIPSSPASSTSPALPLSPPLAITPTPTGTSNPSATTTLTTPATTPSPFTAPTPTPATTTTPSPFTAPTPSTTPTSSLFTTPVLALSVALAVGMGACAWAVTNRKRRT